jgi:HPt (histidine-containing phosphotransfer) domain-containing protein
MTSLKQAILEGNASDTEEISHTLKGELGYLGIPQVSLRAAELEELGRKSDLRLAEGLYLMFESEISQVLTAVRGTVDKVR